MTWETKIAKQQGARLAAARKDAGYRSARAAALENGWKESTYRAHENGTRTMGFDDADIYARRFRMLGAQVVDGQDIIYGKNRVAPPAEVPLVGWVGAGAQAHYYADGQGAGDEMVDAPDGATKDTVAVEIRGESLGTLFDRWLVYYDQVRDPPSPSMLGRLCVVGLADGRILVKQLKRGELPGHYHLYSNTEPPIYDQIVEWAAVVKQMTPR